jgi:hypothetical protein
VQDTCGILQEVVVQLIVPKIAAVLEGQYFSIVINWEENT